MSESITRAEALHELGGVLASLRDRREEIREEKKSIQEIELVIDRLQFCYDYLVANLPFDGFPSRPQ